MRLKSGLSFLTCTFAALVSSITQAQAAVTVTVDPDVWWNAAETAGITKGGSVDLDFYDMDGNMNPDGITDIIVSYNEYYTEGGSGATSQEVSTVAFGATGAFDHAATSVLPLENILPPMFNSDLGQD